MSSVELRTYVTGFPPHSFLIVTGPDGIQHGYGLAPATPNSPSDAGYIYDNTDHLWDESTGEIPLSDTQYQQLMDYINDSIANPPPYSAAFGSQCSVWAFNALVQAGIPAILEPPNLGPDGILTDFLETIAVNPYTQWINLKVRDFFDSSFSWIQRRDPLILDLDGDGIETVGAGSTNPILFDHDGDGIKNGTGWIKSDDGFLVLDRNGNGTIDNGSELFGDSTQTNVGTTASDGFAALTSLDSNHDGIISSADAQFADLRVWRDINQDGISQPSELFTLNALNIASINLAHTNTTQNLGNGNTISAVGSYTKADGTTAEVGGTNLGDANLVEDTFHREFTDTIPFVEGVTELPNMQGSGKVRDLWEAASLSSSLLSELASYSAASSRSEQLAMIDELLFDWADTAGMNTLVERGSAAGYGVYWGGIGSVSNPTGINDYAISGGSSGGSGGGGVSTEEEAEARAAWNALLEKTQKMLEVLEAFNGKYFFSFPTDPFGGASSGATFLSVTTEEDDGNGGLHAVSRPWMQITLGQQQIDLLQQSYDALKESVYNALVLQTRLEPVLNKIVLVPNSDGTGLVLDFTEVEAELQSRIQANTVNGMADLFDFTFAMKDELAGMSWNGWQLVEQNLRTQTVTSELQALYDDYGVKFAATSGGTTSGDSKRDILIGSDTAADVLYGNSGDDALFGGAGNDLLDAGDGNDVVYGGDGNDQLYGSQGDDLIIGGAGDDGLYGGGYYGGGSGDDILDGGVGNDYLVGGFGSDTYLFGLGDGQDTINNDSDGWGGSVDPTANKVDVLQLKAGIGPSDVTLTRSGDDLILKLAGTTDQVRIQGYFYSDGYANRTWAVEQIRFDDGTSWDVPTVKAMTLASTTGNDILTGYASNDVVSGGEGNDLIDGRAGNDNLDGGAGNDTLYAGDGDDVLTGGDGADTLQGDNGDDQLIGGAGDDNLYGGWQYGGWGGNDTLDGGVGNDYLVGGFGSDTYLFGLGDGQDTINNDSDGWNGYSDPAANKVDVLQLKAGIAPSDVVLTRSGDNLVLKVSGTTIR